jgi:hypothetical protein
MTTDHAHDRRLVLDAMRSGEGLRTQWIARVAFDLGTDPWHARHGQRVRAVLEQLEHDATIERRPTAERRDGYIADQHITFEIPRARQPTGESTS